MKQILVAIFALILKSATAQVTANATVAATIVYPVGTEQIGEEKTQRVSLMEQRNLIPYSSLSGNHTQQVSVARFSIVNGASVYAVSAWTHSPYIFLNAIWPTISVQPTGDAAKPDVFTVKASINRNQLNENKPYKESFDVAVHFN